MVKVVSPYRPFPPESEHHKALGEFDWLASIAMARDTGRRFARVTPVILTDLDAEVPEPTHRYASRESRLMLWILEVSLSYLQSPQFNEPTLFISPDILICRPLGGIFSPSAGLGLIIRPGRKYARRPLLNSVQFWNPSYQDELVDFFSEALDRARALSEAEIVWGADTTPLVQMVSPIRIGTTHRAGLPIQMIPAKRFLYSPGTWAAQSYSRAPFGLIDFKGRAKKIMPSFYKEYCMNMRIVRGWAFPTSDRFMVERVGDDGRYQRENLDGALAHVCHWRTAVDGGAHIGTWTIPLAHRFARVLAFEPTDFTYRCLRYNLRRDAITNVEPYQAALWDDKGRIRMVQDPKGREMSNSGAMRVTPGHTTRAIPLDSLDLQDLDFLKLDVEGSEPAALRGALATISRCRPVILFEDKGHWVKYYREKRDAPQKLLKGVGMHELCRIGPDVVWGWE